MITMDIISTKPAPAESWTTEYFIKNENACLSRLEDETFLSSIPDLDTVPLDNLKHGQLVKFQGMIQDMHNPEIYYNTYVVRNTDTEQSEIRHAKFSDMINIKPEEELIDAAENQNCERQSFVVISVPALNNWTRKKDTKEPETELFNYVFDKYIQIHSSKRNIKEEVTDVDCLNTSNKKRKPSTEQDLNTAQIQSDNKTFLSTEYMLNFPVPNDKGKCCIIKLYDEDSTKFKLNQVIDIVGFISLDPRLSAYHDSDEMSSNLEIQTHHPPASIIPRLHAIKVSTPIKPTIQHYPVMVSKFQYVRAELHKILSHLLFNDNLAAEYLLCHLISSVYKRNDYMCFGSFPLNITNFPTIKQQTSDEVKDANVQSEPSIFPRILYSFISTVLTKSVYLACTLENLNDLSFVPKKDYECDRLTSGILQLSDNTHLVIDETGLTSGRVSESGKINYNAVSDLVRTQKLNYDFTYYKMEYETDIPVLILSQASSFINGTIRVPITSDDKTVEAYPGITSAVSICLNDEKLLNHIRDYLNILKFAEFDIEDNVSDVIQADLVQLRHKNVDVSTDDFHRCIVFSRLMAVSRGLPNMTIDCWKQSLELEIERMNRINKLTTVEKQK